MEALSVHLSRLHKSFGAASALNDVTTDFEAGGLHGLIGPDGAGKTTLLRILAGLLRPSSGTVIFRSGNIPLSFPRARPHLAYMPQQQSLYGDLSIGEHLDFFRDLYSIPKASYETQRTHLLHLTRLTPFQDRPAGQLSGGMYKKLGLMCALLHSPRVLLLDEPTNGVDPVSRRELWDLFHTLRTQGLLIIMATSSMDEAERCGKVHLLHNGQLIAAGAPRAVLAEQNAAGFAAYFIQRDHTRPAASS